MTQHDFISSTAFDEPLSFQRAVEELPPLVQQQAMFDVIHVPVVALEDTAPGTPEMIQQMIEDGHPVPKPSAMSDIGRMIEESNSGRPYE